MRDIDHKKPLFPTKPHNPSHTTTYLPQNKDCLFKNIYIRQAVRANTEYKN